ncbi:MAG TPA: HupE/UreJ family protein [Thermoanaerobaculia bacterium]|nr:HupE/UreJ family protein [Thermoanaerobaculia bacterium]
MLSALLATGPILGHESRPGYLELREVTSERYALVWKQPARGELVLRLEPVLPDRCRHLGGDQQELIAGALLQRATVHCAGGLAGGTIGIAGLEATLTDVLVRIEHRSGVQETRLLQPAQPSFVVAGTPATAERVLGYLRLGVEHILLGVDHLLFVLGLLLIVKRAGILIQTVTAFTIAHSITLGIATLGYASAPVEPLSAAIALSILFLGPEVVRTWRGETSFTLRHPWVVAFVFGLLHGFGFASGLTEMGLPRSEIPLALLLFNAGVELGQLLFVVLVLLFQRSFRVLEVRWPRWAQLLPGYAVGSLGAFWTLQRFAILIARLS